MELTYDKEADAIYLKIKEGTFATNNKVSDSTILDLDAKGQLLGIELLDVSKHIPARALGKVHVRNLDVVKE